MDTKTITATVSLSTNPAAAGRYFVNAQGWGVQITATTDAPAEFIAKLTSKALAAGVIVELDDQTGE